MLDMKAPKEQPRSARCAVCNKLKITQRYQRGVTHIEWVRVCESCAGKIYKKNYRHPRTFNQLDLFAK
jgi:hypothetical protein